MRRKLSILALVCALCLSTVFGVVFANNTAVAEDAPTSITLAVKDTANCSNGSAEDVTLGGIAMKKVTKGDNGRTTYKVNLEKTNVTSITGATGTANDPTSWKGAVEVYVYLDMETYNAINFKLCEDVADEWSDIGARHAICFAPAVATKQLVKITAPICAGGYENDLTKLFVNVGGMYFDIYDSTGDVYVSNITFVETALTALTYETISKTLTFNPADVCTSTPVDVTIDGVSMKKVANVNVGWAERSAFIASAPNTNDVTDISGVGNGTATSTGDITLYEGAIQLYAYVDMGISSAVLKIMNNNIDWDGYRQEIRWDITNIPSKKLVKITAPIKAGTFGGSWDGNVMTDLGGFVFDVYGSAGSVSVSEVKFVKTALTALTYETIELPEPTVSVENVKSVTWTGEVVSLKPTITLLDGVTVESATYQVGEEQPVTVTADEDYNYTFNAVGDYTVAYTFVINGQTYNAEKTITVKQSATEYAFNISKMDSVTLCSSAIKNVALSGINMFMVTSTAANTTIGAEVLEDGKPVDITGITKDSRKGAIEFYVYYAGNDPASIEFRLNQDFVSEWSTFYYHQSFNLEIATGKLVKVVLPLSVGQFDNGSTVFTGEEAHTELYNRLGGFMLQYVNGTGTLMMSTPKVISTTATEITTEEVDIELSVNVEGVSSEVYNYESVNLKPTIVLPEGFAIEQATINVTGVKEETITVENDGDYIYEFDTAGEYNFAYTIVINGNEYTATKTVTVKEYVEKVITTTKLDAESSAGGKKVTLAGVQMYAVSSNGPNVQVISDVRVDGDGIDITNITGETRQGAIEFYVYYNGSKPASTEVRLSPEGSSSPFEYHHSFNVKAVSGKLVKYVLPFSTGAFSAWTTPYTGEEAHEKLYNQLGFVMVQFVEASGVMLVSDFKVITTSNANITMEEVAVNEPLMLADNVYSSVVINESFNIKPFVIEPTTGETFTLSVSATGTANIDEFVPATEDDWNITITAAGEYTITYKLSAGQKEFTENIKVKAVNPQEKEIVAGNGGTWATYTKTLVGERTYNNVKYQYVSKQGDDTLWAEWSRLENADSNTQPKFDITSMDLGALALEFYIYADYTGGISNAEVHLGNCTTMYHDYGWTYKAWTVNNIPDAKLVKYTLRLTDAFVKQADAQLVYDNINTFRVYIYGDQMTVGDYMLVSGARLVATNNATGFTVVDETFVPDFTAPTVNASYVGGDYKETYNIVPIITKEGYTGNVTVNVKVGYEGNVLNEYTYTGAMGDDINGKMAADLAAYAFPTGRTYTVSVTATDEYGNATFVENNIEITGQYVDDVKPTIDLSNVATTAKRGDVVDLTTVGITDNVDAGEDLVVTYTVTVNGETVTVTAGKFTATVIGAYNATITATDSVGNSATETFTITVGKKTDTLPTITAPEGFKTEYSVKGQVNLSGYTATAEDGTVLDLVFEVTAPDGSAVTVSNNKFTFTVAGEYKVIIKAIDDDGNQATQNVTITAVGDTTSTEEQVKGCFGSVSASGIFAIALFACVAILRKKEN